MKRLLAALLFLMFAACAAVAQNDAKILTPSEQKLENVPGFPTCFTAQILHGDPNNDQGIVGIIKGTAGCKAPWHWHTANEQLGMVSGTMKLEMKGSPAKTIGAGSYAYMPSKHVHQAVCTTACTFFVGTDSGKFDIHYVDAAGKEMSLEDATKGSAKAAPKSAPKKK